MSTTPYTFPTDIFILIEEITRLQTHLDSANAENKRLRQMVNLLVHREAANKETKTQKKALANAKKTAASKARALKKAERDAKKAAAAENDSNTAGNTANIYPCRARRQNKIGL